jgi:hypothetical protein
MRKEVESTTRGRVLSPEVLAAVARCEELLGQLHRGGGEVPVDLRQRVRPD